ELVVRNPSATTALRYDLTDTPQFPAGVQILGTPAVETSGSAPVWADGTLSLADNRVLDAAAEHTYLVTFRVSVPADAAAATCYFDNTGLVTSGQDTFPIADCAPNTEQVVPTVLKTVTGSTQNADGSW